MFEQFTDSARRVLALSQEAAKGLGHGFISGEHILLAIAEEEGGAGQRILAGFTTARLLRHEVADLHAGTQHPPSGHIPFTPGAKRILELAHRQALTLGVDGIDSAVLLLGVLEERGTAVHLLQNAGVDIDALRRAAVEAVSGASTAADADAVDAPADAPRCPSCSGPLRSHLKLDRIDVTGDPDAGGVAVAYCGRCGAAVGAAFST